MAIKVAQIIFVIAFLGSLSLGACIAGFVFVNFIVTPLVRLVFPTFGVYENPDLLVRETKVDKKEVQLTAIDFIVQEKIRRTRAMKRQLHELMNPKKIETEWDLAAMKAASTQGLIIPNPEASQARPEGLWSIARYTPSGKPRYLCFKLSQKGRGLRTAFASLPDRACKMNRAAAFRWAAVLGIECEVVPMNASARSFFRDEQKEIAPPREVSSEARA